MEQPGYAIPWASCSAGMPRPLRPLTPLMVGRLRAGVWHNFVRHDLQIKSHHTSPFPPWNAAARVGHF